MLSTYVPAQGPMASATYTLPAEQTRKSSLGGPDDSYQPARLQGKTYGAGTGTPFFAGGTKDCIFEITPLYATTVRSFTGSDMATVESAVSEFFTAVVGGGLGTLTDSPPTGFKVVGTDGLLKTCTGKTCTARVVPGSIGVDWQDGGTVALVSVTLECPAGFWTCTYAGGGPVLVPFH